MLDAPSTVSPYMFPRNCWNLNIVIDSPNAFAGTWEIVEELSINFLNSSIFLSDDKTWTNTSTSEVKHAKWPNLSQRQTKWQTRNGHTISNKSTNKMCRIQNTFLWIFWPDDINQRIIDYIELRSTCTVYNHHTNKAILKWYKVVIYLKKYCIRSSINFCSSPLPCKCFLLSISRLARYGHLTISFPRFSCNLCTKVDALAIRESNCKSKSHHLMHEH